MPTEQKKRRFLEKFLEHLGYLKIKDTRRDHALPSFRDRDLLKAEIYGALMSALDLKSPTKAEYIGDITNHIVAKLARTRDFSLRETVARYGGAVQAERLITFGLGCGLACYWELTVRLLAHTIGIDLYCKSDTGVAKSPSVRDLDKILADLKTELPALDLPFGRLARLRNAITHGNFHQLRAIASTGKGSAVLESFKGKVFEFQFGIKDSLTNLSEVKEFERIKKSGPFAWFLDVGNSNAFEAVIQEFQQGIEVAHWLLGFRAFCFEETQSFFKKLCCDGTELSKQERDSFILSRKEFERFEGELQTMIDGITRLRRKRPPSKSGAVTQPQSRGAEV